MIFITWVNKGNGGSEIKAFFDDILLILGLHFENQDVRLDAEIEELIEARQAAKRNSSRFRSSRQDS